MPRVGPFVFCAIENCILLQKSTACTDAHFVFYKFAVYYAKKERWKKDVI